MSESREVLIYRAYGLLLIQRCWKSRAINQEAINQEAKSRLKVARETDETLWQPYRELCGVRELQIV